MLQILEELQERRRGPFIRQAQKREQVPCFDGMNLHRRRRKQKQALRAFLQATHQPQQGVGAILLFRAHRPSAGVMRFVQHDQVPRVGFFQQRLSALATAHELAGGDHCRLLVPRSARRGRLAQDAPGRGGRPVEALAVVDGPIEIELLAQFQLPLLQHRLGRQDENALGLASQPRLPQQQAGLDGLAEAHFVRDEQPWRPLRVQALERPRLMWPRLHGSGCGTHLRTAVGQLWRLLDEAPYLCAKID